jgi:hypothetical protein
LSVLAWLEMQALKMEYAALIKQSAVDDAWYVYRDGATEGPEKFTQVLQRLLEGQSSLAVLPASAVDEEERPWRFISYRSWCLNPVTSTLWIISFWMLAMLFGWALVCTIVPFPVRAFGERAYGLALLALAGASLSPKFRMTLANWQKPRQNVESDDAAQPLETHRSSSEEE